MWLDPLDLSEEKNSFRSGLYTPLRGAYWYCIIFFYKVSFMKHPNEYVAEYVVEYVAQQAVLRRRAVARRGRG